MYFNNSLVLFSLFLVIIPVILHFLNLNKVRKIEFSSLMFLKEVKEKKIRKLKIQYLLLMIIRIFLIVIAVLTFSNPVIKTQSYENSPINSSVVLFDNSPGTDVENTESLNKIKSIISEINNIYSSTTNINLYTIDGIIFGRNRGFNFTGTDLSFNPGRTLTSMIKYLVPVENYKSNDLYIISGFYKSDYTDLPVVNYDYYQNYKLHLININEKNKTNISINSITHLNQIPDMNSKQKFEVDVHNYNNFDVFNKRVKLSINNENIFEKVTDIPAMKSVKLLFEVPSQKQSSINGYAEINQDKISDDEITFDNKKYFSINFPKTINIMLVGDSRNNFEYIEKAINIPGESNLANTLFKINYYNSINNNISDVNLIIISGKKSLSKEDIKNLHSFLAKGYGVIIFPETNMEFESYNTFLKEYTSSLNIQSIDNREKVEDKLIITNTDDILVKGIFENNNNEKSEYSETINIKKIMKVVNSNLIPQIIENSEKLGILYKIPANKKGIFLFTLTPDYSMSDFPSKSIFLPLLYRSIFFLSNNFNSYNFIVGNYGIINVNNESFSIPVDTNIAEAGNYNFKDKAISYNIDERESNLTSAEQSEIINFYKNTGFDNIKYYSSPEQFLNYRGKSGSGVNIYYYLLTILFFTLLAEMFYSRRIMKKLKLIKNK